MTHKNLEKCDKEVNDKHKVSLTDISKNCKDDAAKGKVEEYVKAKEKFYEDVKAYNEVNVAFKITEANFKKYKDYCKNPSGKFRFKSKGDDFANCAEGCLDKIPLVLA
jgi:hypothetical protein